jgi:hypothetical protein
MARTTNASRSKKRIAMFFSFPAALSRTDSALLSENSRLTASSLPYGRPWPICKTTPSPYPFVEPLILFVRVKMPRLSAAANFHQRCLSPLHKWLDTLNGGYCPRTTGTRSSVGGLSSSMFAASPLAISCKVEQMRSTALSRSSRDVFKTRSYS